jgi:hypothetical protein
VLALEEYFISPTEDTLAQLFDSLNEMDLGQMPTLDYLERTILLASDNKDMFREKYVLTDQQSSPLSNHARDQSQDSKRRTFINLTSGDVFQISKQAGPKDCHFLETKIVYTGRKIPIQIPITGNPDLVGDVLFSQTINSSFLSLDSSAVFQLLIFHLPSHSRYIPISQLQDLQPIPSSSF